MIDVNIELLELSLCCIKNTFTIWFSKQEKFMWKHDFQNVNNYNYLPLKTSFKIFVWSLL